MMSSNNKTTDWIKVDDALPVPGVPVLVFVILEATGRTRRLRAQYSNGKSLECIEDDDSGIYDEETGEYFCPVGWYETNEYEEVHWRVDGIVTHWMPLPEPPIN